MEEFGVLQYHDKDDTTGGEHMSDCAGKPPVFLGRSCDCSVRARQMRIRIENAVVLVVGLLVVVFAVILAAKDRGRYEETTAIEGRYIRDESIKYEFDGNGRGRMHLTVDGQKQYYDYAYKIIDNELFIDFTADEKNDETIYLRSQAMY